MRAVALGALLIWIGSFRSEKQRRLRAPALYLFVSIVLSTTLVGALKTVTNVDCPWDLARYGGEMPTLAWFAPRPDELPRAQCFPGAHSASGFSLMCLYFMLGRKNSSTRWIGLAAGIVVGAAFSFAQQVRGAHFLSHDVMSALLCWLVACGIYMSVQQS